MTSPFKRVFLAVALALAAFPLIAQAAPAKFGAISIGGVSVKGLDAAAAKRRVRRGLAPKLKKRVGLAAGPKIAYRKREELGFSVDIGKMLARAQKTEKSVPLLFHVNQARLAVALRHMAPALATVPRDAVPVLYGGKVKIRSEIVGRRIDASTSAARLKIEAEKDASKARFALAVKSSAPQLSRNRLKGINAVIGTFTTRFNPGKVKRTRNMRVAIGSIDGTLLSPGEVFSLNKTVGERTQARGYRTAIIFDDGQKKPGLGGGVSQVTGTLFNAALVAGLPIVTYRVHSRPVAYLPIGRDATVAWGSFDMKFKNDTKTPIYVSYKLNGSHATVTLFGKRSGKKGSLKVVSHRNKSRDISAILYRTIRQNGKVVKKEKVGSSHYDWKKDNGD